MKAISLFVLAILLSMVGSVRSSQEKQPNIIYILSDDLGHADLGFTGGRIETPHLDKLANEGWIEHSAEDDDSHHSGVSLDVDRGTAGDSSSNSSRQLSPREKVLRGLSRTLHLITSTLSHQDTVISTGSSSVFTRSKTCPPQRQGTDTTMSPGCSSGSRRGTLRSKSTDRSTPSLWYENITTPLKASKKMFREILADIQGRTFSFGASHLAPSTSRGRSDADDLNLYDNVYTGSHCTSRKEEVAYDLDDDTFLPAQTGTVFCNRIKNTQPDKQLERLSTRGKAPRGRPRKSQSTGDLVVDKNVYGFEPNIKFNNFVLDSSL